MTGRVTANELAAALRGLGWSCDVGGTTVYLHRRTLARISIDIELWSESLDALLKAAVALAKADAAARKRQP